MDKAKRDAYYETLKVPLRMIYLRDQGICHLCAKPVKPVEASRDHVTPVSRGGKTTFHNIRLAHRSCNAHRGSRPVRTDSEAGLDAEPYGDMAPALEAPYRRSPTASATAMGGGAGSDVALRPARTGAEVPPPLGGYSATVDDLSALTIGLTRS